MNIYFDNGYLKEGGEYKLPEKISKREYQDMIESLQQK